MSEKHHKKHPEPEKQPPDGTPGENQSPAGDSGTNIAGNQEKTQGEPSIEVMMVSKEEYLSLKAQLEQARQQAQEFSDGWQRSTRSW